MSRADADITINETGQVSCRFAMRTDVGLRRTENQDTYGYVRSRLSSLFIVADGMGGARGGATASAIAVDVICREVSRRPLTEATLRQAVERANRAIFDRSRDDENLQGMGTTLVALALVGSQGFLAHVGDSRAYLWREGTLTRLTRDHTLIQELLESGAISDDQAENHPIAHMLTRSLGPARSVEVEFTMLPGNLQRGDRFLLCCDGLYNMVTELEVAKILGAESLDGIASTLIEKANANGGTDNITVQVIEVCPLSEGQSDLGPDELEFYTSSDLDLSDLQLADTDETSEAGPINKEQTLTDSEASKGHVNGNGSEPQSKSSVDSIIFGEMPTDQDIKAHQENVKRRPTMELAADEVAEALAADQSNTEVLADASLDEDRIVETTELKEAIAIPGQDEEGASQLRKIQYGAIATIALAVFVAVYVLIPDGKTPVRESTPLDQPRTEVAPTTTSPETVQPIQTLSPSEPKLVTPTIELVSLGSPFALPESTPLPAPAIQPEVTPEAPKAAEEKVVEPVVEAKIEPPKLDAQPLIPANVEPPVEMPAKIDQPKIDEPEPTVVKGTEAATKKEEAWPEAQVTTSTEEAQLQALAIPATAERVDPNQLAYLANDADPAVARIFASASNLSLPPAPIVRDPKISDAADQPIVWEHEQLALKKAAVATVDNAKTTSAAPAKTDEALVISDDEKKTLFQKKNELRDKIVTIDARIRSFSLRSVEEARKRLAELDAELDLVDQAIEQTNKNIEIARGRLQSWQTRKDFIVTGAEPFKLADEVGLSNSAVKRKKEAHDVTSVRYLEAVEIWRSSPGDNTATQNMTTLGRELRELRAEVEAAVIKGIDDGLVEAIADLATFGVTKSDLERRRDRMNRQVGFIKAHNVNIKENRLERQQKLLEERAKIVAQYEEVLAKLSDQAEADYRKSLIVSQYSPQ